MAYTFDALKADVTKGDDRHRARRLPRHAGPADRQALPGRVLPRRRARGDAWLRLPARQRHRHGAGARLRGRQLGQGLWRLRHEARPGDADEVRLARGHGARASPTSSTTITTSRSRTRRAPSSRRSSRGSQKLGLTANIASSSSSTSSTRTSGRSTTRATANLKTAGYYIEDYHIFQTTKEEAVMRAMRNQLQASGIPVENSKGEWGPGQEEINVRYAEALDHGRPARGHEERDEGDRPRPGQGDHLHGQVGLRPRRLVEPHPHVAGARAARTVLPKPRPSSACRR